jgi:hypothetical protein
LISSSFCWNVFSASGRGGDAFLVIEVFVLAPAVVGAGGPGDIVDVFSQSPVQSGVNVRFKKRFCKKIEEKIKMQQFIRSLHF